MSSGHSRIAPCAILTGAHGAIDHTPSHARDGLHVCEPLPRQAHNEGIELGLCECSCCSSAPSLGQAKRRWFRRRVAHHTPKPSRTTSFIRVPRIGKEVGVVGLRGAEDLHRAGDQAVGAGTRKLHGTFSAYQRRRVMASICWSRLVLSLLYRSPQGPLCREPTMSMLARDQNSMKATTRTPHVNRAPRGL